MSLSENEHTHRFENFDFSLIFSNNQSFNEVSDLVLQNKNEDMSPLYQSQHQSNGFSETDSLLPDLLKESSHASSDDLDIVMQAFSPKIIDDFNFFVMNEMFMESKSLLDSLIMKDCKEYRIMSMGLIRLHLFSILQAGKSDKATSVYDKLLAFDDDFTCNNGFLDFLLQNPKIFQTSFFSQMKMAVYVPALKQLALLLLAKEGLLSTYDLSLAVYDETIYLRLDNIEEEMTYYMICYQRIFESTGEFNEIYLSFSSTYDSNDLCKKNMIYNYINQHERNSLSDSQDFTQKKVIYIITKEKPESRSSKNKSICTTTGSDQTSESSKEILREAIPNDELLNFEFTGVDKSVINKMILKLFKRFIRASVKSKRKDYSNSTLDFSNNKLNPPIVIQGVRYRAFNYDYMHWLFFTNSQIALLYSEFKTQCRSYLFDKLVLACNIVDSKDILYLKAYINQLSALYCTEQPPKIKKRMKISEPFKPANMQIFKVEQLQLVVKRNRISKVEVFLEDVDNNFEDTRITDDISHLLTDVYNDFAFN